MKRHPDKMTNMMIIEEFFKKNNFEIPRIFIQDKIGTKYATYTIEKDYLFKFVKKMSVLKGVIQKNFFEPEDFEVNSSDSEDLENYSSDDDSEREPRGDSPKRKNMKRLSNQPTTPLFQSILDMRS